MIFVYIAYENVEMHTLGFLGFQVCLMLMALQTVIYILETDHVMYNLETDHVKKHRFFGKYTKYLAIAFIIGDLIIFAFKVTATFYVVLHGRGAPWTMRDSHIGDTKIGELVDLIWMIFNALAPLIISFIRMMHDRKYKCHHLKFTVKFNHNEAINESNI